MKLPGVGKAVVPKEKTTEYLLSREHWTGKGKAKFFSKLGFQLEKWGVLADALVEHAIENDITRVEETVFGMKYIIEGEIGTLSGKRPVIRAVWFIRKGESVPRFVTAYPFERRKRHERA